MNLDVTSGTLTNQTALLNLSNK